MHNKLYRAMINNHYTIISMAELLASVHIDFFGRTSMDVSSAVVITFRSHFPAQIQTEIYCMTAYVVKWTHLVRQNELETDG